MRWPVVALWGFAAVVAAACGARTGLETPFIERPSEEPQGGGPPECVVYQSSAQLAALDVFVLLDKSGSMSESAVGGSKWISVRLALSSFFFAPESAGIGVALSYFPVVDPSMPAGCTQNQPCASPGVCIFNKVCGTSGLACIDQANCVAKGVGDQPCVAVGICPDDSACMPDIGLDCATGSCLFAGVCDNDLGCDPLAYGEPAMEVSRLPEWADELLANLMEQSPGGATPTVPAMTGVTELATAWRNQNPDHEVIILLATDGEPSNCGSSQLPNDALVGIAAEALEQDVRTFVIGVFGVEQAEEAKASLGNIAAAGGTENAFVITTAQQVDDAFLEALNEIRLDAKACEFGLPITEPIDFDGVWVKITNEMNEEIWVPLVEGPGDCDGGGFYYDPPPSPDDAFINLVLCPESCTLLGASPDRRAEIFTSCPDAPNQ